MEVVLKKFILSTCVLVFMLAATGFSQNNSDDWKGFYVGANLGGAFGGSNARTTTIFDPAGYFDPTSVPAINAAGDQHVDLTGFTGGGQIGYNARFAKTLLFGVEADFGSLNLNNSKTTTAEYPCCSGSFFTVNQSVNTGWMFTARPRVGVTFGKALIYGTGGVGVTKNPHKTLFKETFDKPFGVGGGGGEKKGGEGGGG